MTDKSSQKSSTSNTPLSTEELLRIDREHCWHPYSSFDNPPPVYPVESAEGVRLTLRDGREVIDGMSSWWCTIHGYNHPILNKAAEDQLKKMSHVMFGGITHEPAVQLVKKLVEITPEPLQRVFLSDSGSIAVEVAIKMAIQYWQSQGVSEKSQLLTVRNGYHGDTFATMAVCDPVNGMHHLFSKALQQHLFAAAPPQGFDRPFEEQDIAEFKQLLEENHQQLAAVILEPIVQGAGGMRFYSPHYLKRVRELCDEFNVLLIADEIATGFGRTGKLFACEHADICPDILCLGKAITGGYMTLAATLCTEKVSKGICSGEAGVFMHGPTFMGNPLACAVANASIELLLSSPWQENVARLEAGLKSGLAPCKELDSVEDVRVLGAIGVVELKEPVKMAEIQERLVDNGVWLRPFGKLVYTMPQFVMNDKDLATLTEKTYKVLAEMA
ncbi:MAG: adenosylmethionine--8-amino-7-oxononanoate transaminase [Cellvibrionaceae bacterium]